MPKSYISFVSQSMLVQKIKIVYHFQCPCLPMPKIRRIVRYLTKTRFLQQNRIHYKSFEFCLNLLSFISFHFILFSRPFRNVFGTEKSAKAPCVWKKSSKTLSVKLVETENSSFFLSPSPFLIFFLLFSNQRIKFTAFFLRNFLFFISCRIELNSSNWMGLNKYCQSSSSSGSEKELK